MTTTRRNAGSAQRKRASGRYTPPSHHDSANTSDAGWPPPEQRAGCATAAVWLLAWASFAGFATESRVIPIGLVFAIPCWLLSDANRDRVPLSWVASLVALGAVVLGVIELMTGTALYRFG